MKAPSKNSKTWSAIRKQLATFDQPALVAIVKDLYDLASANREFLHARFQFEEANGAALESYRKKVIEQFFPARGFGKLKLGEARKAIRDYRKATGDIRGTADLLMTFVENGTDFTCTYGDIDSPFYSSIESGLDDLVALIRTDATELYPIFAERLDHVNDKASGIGWGFGDYVSDVISQLADDLGSGD